MRWFALFLFSMPILHTAPPVTRRENFKEALHGVEIADPYRWLEDQTSPETRAWVEAQHKHTRSILDQLPGRKRLARRAAELTRVDSSGLPVVRNGRYFFQRRAANQEQNVYYLRRSRDARDEVLVDANTLSRDGTKSVAMAGVSDDGVLFAYGIQEGGKDERAIRILNVDTGKHLSDELPEGKWGGVGFTPDNKRFYYAEYGVEQPRVREHAMGRPVSEDREIFGVGFGKQHILYSGVSDDGNYLVITVFFGSSEDLTEVYIKDLRTDDPVKPIAKGVTAGVLGDMIEGRLIAKTNWKAPNWRIVSIDPVNPDPEHWKELVPEGKHVIESLSAAGGKLFVSYLEDVQTRIRIFTPDGKPSGAVNLPAAGTASGFIGRWQDHDAYYTFNSFHIAPTVFRVDAKSGSQEMWFRQSLPLDSSSLELRQVWYQSKDGTRVPMFLLHKKGLKPNGALPVWLTGYGGFNVANTPAFQQRAVMWAELGGVYALANLRGGAEFGERWHKSGMLGNKQNVFDDFISAAEYLIREKYTNPKKLAIQGTSNGGLLVGAAMTQRPELFQAVVCGYPLLDMIRYHKFLVARFWVPEYGSSEDPEQFRYLLKYSPYHNVKPGTDYPATMIVTGDFDTRVDPLHGRKMAALLQAAQRGKRPVLLHYDTKSGHSGGLSTTKQVDVTVDMVIFLASQLGMQVN